jgi:hypothetical protein
LILKLLRPESCVPWPKCYDVAVERERKKRNTDRRRIAFLLRLLLRSQSHDYICSSGGGGGGGGGGAVFHNLDMALCDRALHPFDEPTLRITNAQHTNMVAKLFYREGEPESAPSFPNYAQTREKQASAVSTPDSLQQHEKENPKNRRMQQKLKEIKVALEAADQHDT